uniref:histidine--tRNA ligase n=1 Tax=Asparagopsis taxiformis TaxID=260499 RepID=A0A1C9CCA4_9FLOR|nr:histidine-tRNA synthetase [Asparagopsis taxiformis]AOM66026.1 histidine-tRNA synthetase [Asparagopsis taxiformis]
MQPLRGTKDILPEEIKFWQYIYNKALTILTLYNYKEIRTPIFESTTLFKRSIGNDTDIVNKEMYSFKDQGDRDITLRPEGTASIARSIISNKLYANNQLQKLWYLGPMFRYERPQSGRQRQFHQLGIECIGSISPMADAEVIRIATQILQELKYFNYRLELNSIGNPQERSNYTEALKNYLIPYEQDLDDDSKKRLHNNTLRILDTKNTKTLEILDNAPLLNKYLEKESQQHFQELCIYLDTLNIKYNINPNLVRGLDYYNYTAFEIKTNHLNSQNTICGGGRYDTLIQQLGGPNIPAVGWAIGIERLLLLIKTQLNINNTTPEIYIAAQGEEAKKEIWHIIPILEELYIKFEINFDNNSITKQIKKAYKSEAKFCLILGENEIFYNTITLKWLKLKKQETIARIDLKNKLLNIKHETNNITFT